MYCSDFLDWFAMQHFLITRFMSVKLHMQFNVMKSDNETAKHYQFAFLQFLLHICDAV